MSYVPAKAQLGAVPTAGWGIFALVAIGAIGAVAFWPTSKRSRKSWLSYNSQARRACRVAARPTKEPPKPITC